MGNVYLLLSLTSTPISIISLSMVLSKVSSLLLGNSLGRNVSILNNMYPPVGFKSSSTPIVLSQQHCFHDSLFMGGETISEARCWKKMLQNYSFLLGERINLHKNDLFLFNTPRNIHNSSIEYKIFYFHSNYLGMSLSIGKFGNGLWLGLLEHIQSKLDCWKGSLLRNYSKLYMLMEFIQSTSIHFM